MIELTATTEPARRHRNRRATVVLVALTLGLLAFGVLFMTYDLRGSLDFALKLRGRKLGAMLVVGTGLGTSAVLFHTITHNRILTPTLIGFSQLYMLIQTLAAWLVGTFAFLAFDARLRFTGELVVMLAFAVVLERVFIRRAVGDLPLLVLAGIVLGATFTSLTNLVARMLDPNEYTTLQDQFFASFATVDEALLGFVALLVAVVVAAAWRAAPTLDVMVLGRDLAIELGVDHDRIVRRTMLGVAVLVAAPTALVGPVTFLGLLVANLAYRATGSFRHRITLPTAAIAGSLGLVGAQFTLEEFFEFQTRASIVISVVGGIAFLALLLREERR